MCLTDTLPLGAYRSNRTKKYCIHVYVPLKLLHLFLSFKLHNSVLQISYCTEHIEKSVHWSWLYSDSVKPQKNCPFKVDMGRLCHPLPSIRCAHLKNLFCVHKKSNYNSLLPNFAFISFVFVIYFVFVIKLFRV